MKLLLLITLLGATGYAAGPLYKHKDAHTDQEFQNAYHDIRAVASTVLASSATFITAATNTTGTTLTDSGLSVTIRPKSANNKILILATAQILALADAGQTIVARLVIDRDGSTVFDDVRAAGVGAPTGAQSYFTVPFTYLDSPATASSTTYKVRFARASGSGTGTIFFNDGNSASSLVAIEIAQ